MLKKLRIQNFKRWKDFWAEVGITVHFLCPEYAQAKYAEKMGT